MMSAIATVTQIDAYTRQMVQRIDRFNNHDLPVIEAQRGEQDTPGTCQTTYASPCWEAETDECYRKAEVTDMNSGLSMCRKCAAYNCPEILGEA